MDTILKHYNSVLDSLFFHHTISQGHGKRKTNDRLSHSQFELVYLIDGEVEYAIEGEEYLAKPGDLLVVAPNAIHVLHSKEGARYERIVLLFDVAFFNRILGDAVFESVLKDSRTHRILPKEIVAQTKIEEIMRAITQTEEKQKYIPLHVLSLVLNLIIEMDKALECTKQTSVAPLHLDAIVKKTVEYVNENIEKPLHLDEIASVLYVSKSTLCHKFTRCMGVSVNQYVTLKKIHYAAGLMKSGLSAAEACAAVGYEHYTTFYHNYKKVMGEAPSHVKLKNGD